MVIWGILSKFVGSDAAAGQDTHHSDMPCEVLTNSLSQALPTSVAVGTYNVYIFNTCLDSQ